VQDPPWQSQVGGHTRPHAPQFSASVMMFLQPPRWQQTSSALQLPAPTPQEQYREMLNAAHFSPGRQVYSSHSQTPLAEQLKLPVPLKQSSLLSQRQRPVATLHDNLSPNPC
jgi:hypothetical protein